MFVYVCMYVCMCMCGSEWEGSGYNLREREFGVESKFEIEFVKGFGTCAHPCTHVSMHTERHA